jgi:hypothetical protein
MEVEFRNKDFTDIPDTARISAKKNLDTIQELLKDPYKLNLVMSSYSSYDDHIRRLAKKIKKSKNFVLRSFIEDLLREPEIAVEIYENSESLPDWFREVLRDFVISIIGRIKLRCDL